MKSRLDILEELDIRCGQLDQCRSLLRHSGKKRFQIMVKGVRRCLYAVIFYVTIECFSNAHEQTIKNFIYNNNGLGTYSFEFANIDGTFRREDGGIASNTKGVLGFVVRGEYGYIDPEGRQHSVKYTADVNGYQPHADIEDIRYNDRRIV